MSSISLPENLLRDIISRVGKRNFRDLRPFIFSGKRGRDAVYSTEVLQTANVSEFFFATGKVLHDTPYRAFFRRCVDEANENACLLEGLRLAFCESNLERALAVLYIPDITTPFIVYVLGMLCICAGSYVAGISVLRSMKWWEDVNKFNLIGLAIEAMIQGLKPSMKYSYQEMFECPKPACACVGVSVGTCVLCCVYFNARRMLSYS